jgi:CRP-like cAMP-binding protein
MDHSLGSLTPASVLLIPHATMLRLFDERPSVARLFWRATLIDAAIFREWMVGLGRRDSYTRLAHMFCELVTQMRVVGLGSEHSCHLPLTQADIADATGMSTVHVNRTLQALRAAGLIKFQGGSLEVLDWDGLSEAGEFDPAYLHLKTTAA